MATICPFAEWRPLPEATSQSKITVNKVIYHTAVGTLRGVERYFRDSTSIESHVMVGGPVDGPDLDGVIWQWMDLERRADANRQANGSAVSVETSDNHPQFAEDIDPWSPKQLASLVRFGNWCADRFNIPRRQCPTPDAGGFGWHAMWSGTDFMLPDGTSPWTPAKGKQCPGPKRIHQLKTIVFPAIFAGVDLDQEEDMDEATFKKWVREVLNEGTGAGQTSWATTVKNDLRVGQETYNRAHEVRDALVAQGTTSAEQTVEMLFARVRNIENKVEAIAAELVGEVEPPPSP